MPIDLRSNILPAGSGPYALNDGLQQELIVGTGTPVPVYEPPADYDAAFDYADNSVIAPVSNITVNNNSALFGVYNTKLEFGYDADLATAFGGGSANPFGMPIPGFGPGNAFFVPDAEDTTAGADTNCRIWVRFDNKSVWWPVRGGFELSGFPYTTVYAKWDAQPNKKMYLRGWQDTPVDRVDSAS